MSSSLSRQNTIEQRPKNQQSSDIPLSETHFVIEDYAYGQNQWDVYEHRQILFEATLRDTQGNVATVSDTNNNQNQYTLILPTQVIYTRHVTPPGEDGVEHITAYEGHQTSNELQIVRNYEEEEEWSHITTDSEQDYEVLDRNTYTNINVGGGAMTGRILRQANVLEVTRSQADVSRAGGPVNVANLTPWHDIKF